MKFIDCKSGLMINLEHIAEIDTDLHSVTMSYGTTHYMNPDLFEEIMNEIDKHLLRRLRNGKIEIRLTGIGVISSNKALRYSVELSRECTLGEFIACVLELKREWGCIKTNKGDYIKYCRGEIVGKSLKEESLLRKILKIQGRGGWSRIDYNITI